MDRSVTTAIDTSERHEQRVCAMLSPSKPIDIVVRSRSSNGETEIDADISGSNSLYSASGGNFEKMSFRSGSLAARAKNTKNLSLSGAAPRPICTSTGSSRTNPSSPRTARTQKVGPRLLALDTSFHRLNLHRTGSMPLLARDMPSTPTAASSMGTGQSHYVDRESQELDFYPNGPVCIEPPNLWLYSAPSAVLARGFDLIVNVAHEIPCPFEAGTASRPRRSTGLSSPGTAALAHRNEHDPTCASHGASSLASTATTPDSVRTDTSPATTGSACGDCGVFLLESPSAPSDAGEQLEYIHIPWQHNQAIAMELTSIVDLMEDRIERGNKKTLIHCQQGISRSASLVIAYVMKTRRIGLNEAYAHVKDRSDGIGPNMSLIYQLTDWGAMLHADRSPPRPSSINLSEHTSSSTLVPSPVDRPIDTASPTETPASPKRDGDLCLWPAQTAAPLTVSAQQQSSAGARYDDLTARLPEHCICRRYSATALGRRPGRPER